MGNILKRKTIVSISWALIISLASVTLFAIPANASAESVKLPNGGHWSYQTVHDYHGDYRSIYLVQKIIYVSPSQVHVLLDNLADKVGISESKSIIKVGTETAVSYGITAAKKAIVKKFGEKALSYAIPYLSLFSWGYTAYDVINATAEGQELHDLANAEKHHTGLIEITARSGPGDGSKTYLWNGSTHYGKYPYAPKEPNSYEYGKFKIY